MRAPETRRVDDSALLEHISACHILNIYYLYTMRSSATMRAAHESMATICTNGASCCMTTEETVVAIEDAPLSHRRQEATSTTATTTSTRLATDTLTHTRSQNWLWNCANIMHNSVNWASISPILVARAEREWPWHVRGSCSQISWSIPGDFLVRIETSTCGEYDFGNRETRIFEKRCVSFVSCSLLFSQLASVLRVKTVKISLKKQR